MSSRARRFFGCLVPLALALGGCATCAMVVYAGQVFAVVTEVRDASMSRGTAGGELATGASVVVDNTAFWARDPFRGEIVFVKSPAGRTFRRVIGRPGDVVSVVSGNAIVDGITLDETAYATGSGPDQPALSLGPNEYFVLADDRSQPDSRQWGPLPRRLVFGSAAFIRSEGGEGPPLRAVTGHHRYPELPDR